MRKSHETNVRKRQEAIWRELNPNVTDKEVARRHAMRAAKSREMAARQASSSPEAAESKAINRLNRKFWGEQEKILRAALDLPVVQSFIKELLESAEGEVRAAMRRNGRKGGLSKKPDQFQQEITAIFEAHGNLSAKNLRKYLSKQPEDMGVSEGAFNQRASQARKSAGIKKSAKRHS